MESTREKIQFGLGMIYNVRYFDIFFVQGAKAMHKGGLDMVSVKTSFLFQSRYENFSIHFKVIIYDVSENK